MKIILVLSLLLGLSAFAADENTVQPTPTDANKGVEATEDVKGTITPSSPDQEKQLEENKKVHEDHVKHHAKAKHKAKAKKAGKKAKAKSKKKHKQ